MLFKSSMGLIHINYGFQQAKNSKVLEGNGCVEGHGVAMSIAVVGQVTGNAVYSLEEIDARKIVSKMMMTPGWGFIYL